MRKIGLAAKQDFTPTGWRHVGYSDFAGFRDRRPCENACGAKRVRYAHLLRHRDGREILVGSDCAAQLLGEETSSMRSRHTAYRKAVDAHRDRVAQLDVSRRLFEATIIETDDIPYLRESITSLKRQSGIVAARAEEADRIWQEYQTPEFATASEKHHFLLHDIGEALERAETRLAGLLAIEREMLRQQAREAERQRERQALSDFKNELRNPVWRETRKGFRFVTSYNDALQIYKHRGQWRGLYELADRGEPSHSPPLGNDLEDAKRRGMKALIVALRKAGRLSLADSA